MKFALIGDDPAALELLRAIAASPVDHLATTTFLSRTQAEVSRIAPAARSTARWDELLADPTLDGVIVAGSDPKTLEAAKQLATAGKPLLVIPHANQGSTFFYELSLVRDDTGVLLFPVVPARADDQVAAVRAALAGGAIGRLQYLELTRELPDTSPLLTINEIDAALLPDVDLLRYLGGDYNQVTALHFGTSPAGVATTTVTISGGELPEAGWNAKRAAGKSVWELKLTGEQGSILLTRDEQGSFSTNIPQRTDAASNNRGAAILAQFKSLRESSQPSRDWTDLVRAMEIVEATHRSVRRRRTIDLHFETTSERSLFKTQMTAIGCGILTFTLLAVVALLIATPLLDQRDRKQMESERADAVLADGDFRPGEAALSEEGETHLDEIARRMPADRFNVLVERVDGNEALGEQRRERVAGSLKERGAADAEQRTVVAEIRGRTFATLLRIARIAVFVPLFLFLGLQLLLFLTRPSAN
jgi:predicted dehydrogenase